jgi:DNA-binding transcriptional LysR family regulator
LLERDTRRVTLTPAGETLVERARTILAAADRAARECREVGDGKLGTLRISVSGLSGIGRLPEALRRFQKMHPTIVVELSRASSAAQVSALLEDELDLALSHVPLADDRICLEPVQEGRLYAVLPENHSAAKGHSVSWAMLQGETHIVLSRSVEPEVARTFLDVARNQGERRPKIIEVEDVSLMFALVAAGLGISHLPEDAIRLGFRGVVALPIEPAVSVPLYAARAVESRSLMVDALLTLLRSSS